MIRNVSSLASRRFDVLVIGGGIHGLAVAYDAAQRGLSTALVERADFGSGSSFNHAKTVHGGLRSLQSGDLVKARFSIGERRAMARIAPPLVTPLAFMMGTTRTIMRSTWAMRAGFLLDAALGFDRNAGVTPHLRLPAGRVLGREDYERAFGSNARAGVTGVARWSDYHMAESDRLTLAFAQAAAAHGAVLANYAEATDALVRDGRLTGLRVVDRLSGAMLDVEARITVNAAGAACRPWMERFGARPTFPLLKAMNLVTTRPAGPVALSAPTSGGRLLLIMPWRGRMLVGTSHSDQPADPADTRVGGEELRDFVAEVNSAFPALGLSERDVTLVHRGVVPAVRDRRGALGLMGHHRIHDHARDGVAGAISVAGVKYTTARGVAQQVVDLAGSQLGVSMPACRTGASRLPFWDFVSVGEEEKRAAEAAGALLDPASVRALVATHGTAWRPVVARCEKDPAMAARLAPNVPYPAAAVVHAIEEEMAVTLADVVVRRLPMGSAGHPGDEAVAACGAVMAAALGWDAERLAAEIGAVRDFYRIG
ncbi:MAG: FAD-dependent oxidoreductase [Vicinamibacterales bacterium]